MPFKINISKVHVQRLQNMIILAQTSYILIILNRSGQIRNTLGQIRDTFSLFRYGRNIYKIIKQNLHVSFKFYCIWFLLSEKIFIYTYFLSNFLRASYNLGILLRAWGVSVKKLNKYTIIIVCSQTFYLNQKYIYYNRIY